MACQGSSGRGRVLQIRGALAQPSGGAPQCTSEPSLTVGLVPRIATGLVPTGSLRVKLRLWHPCRQHTPNERAQTGVRVLMPKLVEGSQLFRPLSFAHLILRIVAGERDGARVGIDDSIHHLVDAVERGFALRTLGLVRETFAVVRRQSLIRPFLIRSGEQEKRGRGFP